VVPISERDYSRFYKEQVRRARLKRYPHLTIVDIIRTTVGVVWIINDQRSTQAITVLSPIMAVIPVCTLKWSRNQLSRTRGGRGKLYRLLVWIELVVEALARHNRALRDEGRTVGVIGTLLKQTVPML
jgi:hypothetical protein